MDALKEKLAECYKEYRGVQKELREFCADDSLMAKELSLAEFEYEEIVNANITIGEDGTISRPVVPKCCVAGTRSVSQLIEEMRYGTCLWEKKYIRKMEGVSF